MPAGVTTTVAPLPVERRGEHHAAALIEISVFRRFTRERGGFSAHFASVVASGRASCSRRARPVRQLRQRQLGSAVISRKWRKISGASETLSHQHGPL
jgi:hypothetical protein